MQNQIELIKSYQKRVFGTVGLQKEDVILDIILRIKRAATFKNG